MALPLMVPAKGVKLADLQVTAFADFTGGLDWTRGGNLDPKSTDDMLDVEVFRSGGFGTRRGLTVWSQLPVLPAPVYSLGTYESGDGNSFLIIGCTDGTMWYCLEGPCPPTKVPLAFGAPYYSFPIGFRGLQVNHRWYFQDGESNARFFEWVGGPSAATLGTAYNGTSTDGTRTPLATPGSMPIAKYMAFYHERIFVMWTNESNVTHPNRVRWSYPIVNGLGAEDFRSDTWVDVGGDEGDEIVGGITHGASLFVFKRNSIHHIEGFDETDLSFLPLNLSAGAVGPDAFCNSEDGIFFWDATKGLCQVQRAPIGSDALYNVVPLADQLETKLRDGTVPLERLTEVSVSMGLGESRVHCSVPWKGGGRRMLVFERTMKCWMVWDMNLMPMHLYRPINGRSALVAGHQNPDRPWRVLEVGGTEQAVDYYGTNISNWVAFDSRYRTACLGLDAPFTPKGVLVMEAIVAGSGALHVEVARDWDPNHVTGSMDLALPGPPPFGPQTPPILPLDVGTLARRPMEVIHGGLPSQEDECAPRDGYALDATGLATERAVGHLPRCHYRGIQFTFNGPANGSAWQVLAFSLKWFAQSRAM